MRRQGHVSYHKDLLRTGKKEMVNSMSFLRKLKKNIEKLVIRDKKYSWEDEADIIFRKAVVKENEK